MIKYLKWRDRIEFLNYKKTNSNPLYGEVRPPKLQYKVVLPENSDVLSKLEQNDVEISAKRANESNSAFGMGSSLITILLVLGFIMLIIKSIQAGWVQQNDEEFH